MKKLSDHLKSQAKTEFKSSWQQLEEYQDALVSHIPLNFHMDPDELVTFVSDTEPEAKCDRKVVRIYRQHPRLALYVIVLLLFIY